MFIKIEIDSEIPIYTQLVNGLIEGIANHSLQAKDVLPSVRTLAADLGINMHTVNKAYHELGKKGIVSIIPKSGAVINAPSFTKNIQSRIEDDMRPVLAEALALGIHDDEIISMMKKLIFKVKEGQE